MVFVDGQFRARGQRGHDALRVEPIRPAPVLRHDLGPGRDQVDPVRHLALMGQRLGLHEGDMGFRCAHACNNRRLASTISATTVCGDAALGHGIILREIARGGQGGRICSQVAPRAP